MRADKDDLPALIINNQNSLFLFFTSKLGKIKRFQNEKIYFNTVRRDGTHI